MAPGRIARNLEEARRSTLTRPVVRSAASDGQLARSLRRLGADDSTVARLTGTRPDGSSVALRRPDGATA